MSKRETDGTQLLFRYLLTVSRKSVLKRVDRDGVHRELVRGTENTNGDFLWTRF